MKLISILVILIGAGAATAQAQGQVYPAPDCPFASCDNYNYPSKFPPKKKICPKATAEIVLVKDINIGRHNWVTCKFLTGKEILHGSAKLGIAHCSPDNVEIGDFALMVTSYLRAGDKFGNYRCLKRTKVKPLALQQ